LVVWPASALSGAVTGRVFEVSGGSLAVHDLLAGAPAPEPGYGA
jgi:hypothetical protein